jgi:hypothetical protein
MAAPSSRRLVDEQRARAKRLALVVAVVVTVAVVIAMVAVLFGRP